MRRKINILGLEIEVGSECGEGNSNEGNVVVDHAPSGEWLSLEHASHEQRLAFVDDVMPPTTEDDWIPGLGKWTGP